MIWDLRWHLSQCGSSVLMRSQTTKRQLKTSVHMCIELCSDKHITLSTQIWINWLVSYKLMSETLRFPQSWSSGYCCTQSRDFSSLRSPPQSEEREHQHTAYANIQVHTAWPSIQVHTAYANIQVHAAYPSIQVHTATDALPVYATVLQFCQSLATSSCRYNSSDLWVVHTSCLSHWFSLRWNGGFSFLLEKVIKQSDSPCMLQSTCCVCVNSLIPLVCSSCACSRDNVSVWVIWYSVRSRSTKFFKKIGKYQTRQNCHQTWIHLTSIKTLAENLTKNLCYSP